MQIAILHSASRCKQKYRIGGEIEQETTISRAIFSELIVTKRTSELDNPSKKYPNTLCSNVNRPAKTLN